MVPVASSAFTVTRTYRPSRRPGSPECHRSRATPPAMANAPSPDATLRGTLGDNRVVRLLRAKSAELENRARVWLDAGVPGR